MFVLLRLKSIGIMKNDRSNCEPVCSHRIYISWPPHTILTCSLQNNIVSRARVSVCLFFNFCVLPFEIGISVFESKWNNATNYVCCTRLIRRARHSHAAHSDRKWTCSCARALTQGHTTSDKRKCRFMYRHRQRDRRSRKKNKLWLTKSKVTEHRYNIDIDIDFVALFVIILLGMNSLGRASEQTKQTHSATFRQH